MGNAKCLVEIEVADIGTEMAWSGDTDERVEIGAVEIHLTACVVDSAADLADGFFEHTVG